MEFENSKTEKGSLVINYKSLGTISIDELAHAIIEDIKVLRDFYNVQFVAETRLRLMATNEYGEALRVYRPAGGSIRYMDTHHFRPACKDYDL